MFYIRNSWSYDTASSPLIPFHHSTKLVLEQIGQKEVYNE